jgi:hypothetical protein
MVQSGELNVPLAPAWEWRTDKYPAMHNPTKARMRIVKSGHVFAAAVDREGALDVTCRSVLGAFSAMRNHYHSFFGSAKRGEAEDREKRPED